MNRIRPISRVLNSSFSILHSKRGFSLLELLIFAAIFTVVMVSFITILVAVVRVQSRQTAVAEVNQQSQFLLQQIQYNIERSSLVELSQDVTTTTLKLRMSASSTDPTYITLSGGVVYLQKTDSGTQDALTSSKVTVTDLSFTKRSNAPSHDSVSISFTVEFNSDNLQEGFIQSLNTAVARVSAATFDSNVVPSSTATYSLGASGQTWTSVNDLLYFSGSNVGVGVSNPGQTLEVNGGLRLNTVTSKPTCVSGQRGTFWVTESGGGVKDAVEVCVKNASGTYLWSTIY